MSAGVPVRTGLRSDHVYASCGSCSTVIDLYDMPWFSGVVYCSDACLANRRSEPAVYAVLQSTEKASNVSSPDGEST